MCEFPVVIGNNEPWNGWPIGMEDSNPHDGENIRLSGEGADQSDGKEKNMLH